MKNSKIVVVGAGIGGLQTALALAKDGHRVTVLESAKAFEEVFISQTRSNVNHFSQLAGRRRHPYPTQLTQTQQLLGR